MRAYRQHLTRLEVQYIPITDERSHAPGAMEKWDHWDPFGRVVTM